jgi:hypothetical protein
MLLLFGKIATFNINNARARPHFSLTGSRVAGTCAAKFTSSVVAGTSGEATAEDVDWDAVHGAMKALGKGQHREVMKHVAHCFGTGRSAKRWKKRASPQRCRCGADGEDSTHVIKCPCPKAAEVWEKSMGAFCTWMLNGDANPDVAKVAHSRLMPPREGRPPGTLELANEDLRRTLGPQDLMGWEAAFTGCWAKGWAKEQGGWHRFEHSHFTGKRWHTATAKKLWGVAWGMWQHRNHVLHKEQEALLRQQEDTAICAEFALGFEHFPRHLRAHACRSELPVPRSEPEERAAWLIIIKGGRMRADVTAREARRQAELARQQRAVAVDWLFGQ